MTRLMKHGVLGVLGVALAASMGSAVFAQPLPPHVAGKVVNVSHEKVKINNKWLDKVEVTVQSCTKQGALDTVHYSPATVTDLAALGHLFDQNIHSARTYNNFKQKQINGYGVFWVDANKRVTRTGILGAGVGCAQVPDFLKQF